VRSCRLEARRKSRDENSECDDVISCHIVSLGGDVFASRAAAVQSSEAC